VLEAIIAGAVAGYAISIPVGAIAVLIIQLGIRHGLRSGLVGAAGASTAFGIFALIAMVAGLAVSQLVEAYQQPLRLVAGVVLVAIGVRGLVQLRAPIDGPAGVGPADIAGRWRTYLELFVLTLLNPVAIIFFAALIVGLPELGGMAERAAFVLAVMASSFSWKAFLAALGTVLGRGPFGHRLRRPTAIAGSLLIVGFGVLILWQAVAG
jgi:threonine/homoserine/homoserine lactone efflux protein